jgi:protein TonB
MPRDLFGDVTRPSISIGNRKWYTVPVSLLSHSIVIAMIVVLPILAAPLMPGVIDGGSLEQFIDIVAPDPPPPPRDPDRPQPIKEPPSGEPAAPTVAPTGIKDEPPDVGFETRTDRPGTVIGDFDTRPIEVAPPPPKPVEQGPIRVGGAIRTPVKVRGIDPVYPPIAQTARVQGIVIIEATIGADGRVANARVLRSIPLLDQAALDAVRQWEYTPTTLNGVAVPVVMTVTVSFVLSR